MIEGAEKLEYRLWNTLTVQDREQAFKKLYVRILESKPIKVLTPFKDYDRQLTLQQRTEAAGVDLDHKALGRRLRGENPLLWRTWGSLRVDERRPCFQRFQVSELVPLKLRF